MLFPPVLHTPSTERRTAIAQMRRRYETELFEHVLPFWLEHSLDAEHGGYYNCLDRDGSVYDTTKHSWLQGRQVWMLSALYRHVDARDEWLDAARLGVTFLRQHAVRPNGQVFFSLTKDGKPIYQQRKIFSECFYVMALAEYGRAAGRPELVREAEEALERVWEWSTDLTKVGRPRHEGQADTSSLAIPMILLNLVEVVADDPDAYAADVDDLLDRIERHVHEGDRCVYETVRPDGSKLDGPDGRLLNPGHAIEAGWFMQHWAQHLNRPRLQMLARDVVQWSHDAGWDDAHGGLFYFQDADGYSPVQLEWFMKLWWPHCEALYGHLLNYALFGRDRDWQAFDVVDTYTFDHFPDPECGEWFGYLDRQGRVTHRFKGAPYKGCFHVPRSLWLCWRLLRALESA